MERLFPGVLLFSAKDLSARANPSCVREGKTSRGGAFILSASGPLKANNRPCTVGGKAFRDGVGALPRAWYGPPA